MNIKEMNSKRDQSYSGSTFREVRDQVFSDPYEKKPDLPITKISTLRMLKGFKNGIYLAARRTLSKEADILPYFEKYLHTNGMALTGTWNITEDNPYSGYFKKGSKGLVIVRASVILTETNAGAHRGFGFAAKIFPTLDPDEKVKTGNLLLLHSFVGAPDRYYSDVEVSNHPIIGTGWNVVKYFGVLITTLASFPWTDKMFTYRSVHQVGRLGLEENEEIHSPTWLMVKAHPNRINDYVDFRDELSIENRVGNKIIFDVNYSEIPKKNGKRPWTKMGHIELTESIASESCDHRLHFHHFKMRGSGVKVKAKSFPPF